MVLQKHGSSNIFIDCDRSRSLEFLSRNVRLVVSFLQRLCTSYGFNFLKKKKLSRGRVSSFFKAKRVSKGRFVCLFLLMMSECLRV